MLSDCPLVIPNAAEESNHLITAPPLRSEQHDPEPLNLQIRYDNDESRRLFMGYGETIWQKSKIASKRTAWYNVLQLGDGYFDKQRRCAK